MLSRINCLLWFIAFCAIIWIATNPALGQTSVSEFQHILREKAAFNEDDFAALGQGLTVVKLLNVTDKREVAVCGLVQLQVPAGVFLQSFRESMTQKSNPAILEIGSFSNLPTLADLQTLTIEDRDLDDLKECAVGSCKIKLSAMMIERLHKEVDWEAPDFRVQATQLLKRMLVDYVRDYLARGDTALIEYNDRPNQIRLAEEHGALIAGSGYLDHVFADFRRRLASATKREESLVENAIVWSKIKFGLKPVIAFNHIMVYKRERETGPQIIVASKQIYANHYFDSSLALTAFVTIPGASHGSYLFYENRSRTDGLEGPFSKIKRGIVEDRAANGLKDILETTRANLSARIGRGTESTLPAAEERGWRRWRVKRIHVFLCLLLITAFVALFALGTTGGKAASAEECTTDI